MINKQQPQLFTDSRCSEPHLPCCMMSAISCSSLNRRRLQALATWPQQRGAKQQEEHTACGRADGLTVHWHAGMPAGLAMAGVPHQP